MHGAPHTKTNLRSHDAEREKSEIQIATNAWRKSQLTTMFVGGFPWEVFFCTHRHTSNNSKTIFTYKSKVKFGSNKWKQMKNEIESLFATQKTIFETCTKFSTAKCRVINLSSENPIKSDNEECMREKRSQHQRTSSRHGNSVIYFFSSLFLLFSIFVVVFPYIIVAP